MRTIARTIDGLFTRPFQNSSAKFPLDTDLAPLPPGIWLVQSEAFGVKDLLAALDSELVYSAFTFGWGGVVVVLAAFVVAVLAIKKSPALGLASIATSLIGFSLALHAWDGLGAVWLALTGACVAALTKRAAGGPERAHVG